MSTHRVVSNTNTVIEGRAWRAGIAVEVSADDLNRLIEHVQTGVLVVLPDAPAAAAESAHPAPPANGEEVGALPEPEPEHGLAEVAEAKVAADPAFGLADPIPAPPSPGHEPGQAGKDQAESRRRDGGLR